MDLRTSCLIYLSVSPTTSQAVTTVCNRRYAILSLTYRPLLFIIAQLAINGRRWHSVCRAFKFIWFPQVCAIKLILEAERHANWTANPIMGTLQRKCRFVLKRQAKSLILLSHSCLIKRAGSYEFEAWLHSTGRTMVVLIEVPVWTWERSAKGKLTPRGAL